MCDVNQKASVVRDMARPLRKAIAEEQLFYFALDPAEDGKRAQ